MDILKPCPFCGGEAEYAANAYEIFVECLNCGVKMSSSYMPVLDNSTTMYDKLAEKWNRRV